MGANLWGRTYRRELLKVREPRICTAKFYANVKKVVMPKTLVGWPAAT